MNLICKECKAVIFTPSNDTAYHQKLLDGHFKAVHGDIQVRMVKLLTKCVAVLSLIQVNGGVGKGGTAFTKFQARDLSGEICDLLKTPQPVTDATAPSTGAVTNPTPPAPSNKLFNSGNKGKPAKSTEK
jgi:hypothetical protein